MRRCSILLLSGLVLGTALAGCAKGPPPGAPLATPYRVQGKITLPDGSPLVGGVIYLNPLVIETGSKLRYECVGLVDEQGRYKIGRAGGDEGAPAGEYKVTIKPRDYQELPNTNSDSIPEKYRKQSSTPLTVEVKEQDNTFDFELK